MVQGGRSEPGTRLKFNELCRSPGVGLSVVREALSRLTSEGRVIAEPQRSFSIALVSAGEPTDLTYVRAHIECLCLQRAIAVRDVGWKGRVVAACRLHQVQERKTAAIAVARPAPWDATVRRGNARTARQKVRCLKAGRIANSGWAGALTGHGRASVSMCESLALQHCSIPGHFRLDIY